MSEANHIFWLKRWREARNAARMTKDEFNRSFLARINYSTYLSEVFSWYFENRMPNSSHEKL